MTTRILPKLTDLPEIYGLDPAVLKRKKERQRKYWRQERPDALPIVFQDPLTAAQKSLPDINFSEAFNDDELMLISQIKGACAGANSDSEAIPAIRANLGTGICLATVGLEQDVFPDKMPWLQRHLSLDEALELTVDDIKIQGSFARGMQQMKLFKSVMGDSIDIFCMDTQGPFDLAHLLIGDDIFLEMYDHPAEVHQIMELCLQIGIKTHTWMKEVSGEPMDALTHSGCLYADNMGVRICEDTTCLIGREAMQEFAIPYTRRLASHFGGAWVHYCGRNDHLTELIITCPEIRGINFGIIPGREFEHDMKADMELIASENKLYIGEWYRKSGESGKDFLKRLHYWSDKGALIATNGNMALGKENGFDSATQALDFWRSL